MALGYHPLTWQKPRPAHAHGIPATGYAYYYINFELDTRKIDHLLALAIHLIHTDPQDDEALKLFLLYSSGLDQQFLIPAVKDGISKDNYY